ncbi:MAG: hypothetical protein BWY95_00757 [Bacteroidetes bacterium ADurb.BinA104]|nr:MAG: hypothetical protein BWY95_00757 [Bacteroidetes bacterium ADurb.BinA104]
MDMMVTTRFMVAAVTTTSTVGKAMTIWMAVRVMIRFMGEKGTMYYMDPLAMIFWMAEPVMTQCTVEQETILILLILINAELSSIPMKELIRYTVLFPTL